MLDTGTATASTAGYGQVQAYINTFKGHINTQMAGTVQACFGIGQTSSIRSITINSPIGNITFHIVRADTPFLLCLQDMDKLDIYFNNLTNTVVKRDGMTLKVI